MLSRIWMVESLASRSKAPSELRSCEKASPMKRSVRRSISATLSSKARTSARQRAFLLLS